MSEEYGNDFVTLTDEEGNEYEFEILKELEIDGLDYAALLPVPKEGEEESEEVYIVRVIFEGDDEIYEVIEDDAEYEKAAAEFEAAFEQDIAADDDDGDGDGCGCGCDDCGHKH